VAAPPASSDRLIHPDDLELPADYRTVPVRVDIELSGGRMAIIVNPQELTLKAGDGVEWDFRYFGGADVLVEEIILELDKPSPFGKNVLKSQKPGNARPHRQISGASSASAAGKRVKYTIRCISAFKSDLARGSALLTVLG
jgi:hypothetical protein